MRRLLILLTLGITFIDPLYSIEAPPKKTSFSLTPPRGSKSNRRTFGVGINYTYPAPGLSAKYKLNDQFKVQASVFRRAYDFDIYTYTWSMYGVELDYCFKENKIKKGAVSPFLMAGLGRGQVNLSEFDEFDGSWWAYQVGAGLEWFPKILDGNLGVTWKLGYGSVGYSDGFSNINIRGVLLYGFAAHYYIK